MNVAAVGNHHLTNKTYCKIFAYIFCRFVAPLPLSLYLFLLLTCVCVWAAFAYQLNVCVCVCVGVCVYLSFFRSKSSSNGNGRCPGQHMQVPVPNALPFSTQLRFLFFNNQGTCVCVCAGVRGCVCRCSGVCYLQVIHCIFTILRVVIVALRVIDNIFGLVSIVCNVHIKYM